MLIIVAHFWYLHSKTMQQNVYNLFSLLLHATLFCCGEGPDPRQEMKELAAPPLFLLEILPLPHCVYMYCQRKPGVRKRSTNRAACGGGYSV